MPNMNEVNKDQLPFRLLPLREVRAATGFSDATLLRGQREGWFPKARKVGPSALRWDERDLLAWLQRCPEVDYAPLSAKAGPGLAGEVAP